jgi:hypothetical protein
MYASAAQKNLRRHYENLRREAARVRPVRMARTNHETPPYVVRDLSWELARYLEGADDDR